MRDAARARRPTPTAYVVWAVAVTAFSLTAMQRTTLGVAGLEASQRLDASAASLSVVLLVQTSVFLALNLPAGAFVDQWGPRRTMALGAALAAVAQGVVARADDLGPVLAARVLVGAADAIVLVAALTLVPRWFPPHRVPMMTQLTTLSGQTGQVLSAIPFLALLEASGWTAAFTSAAAASALVAALALAAVRDGPVDRPRVVADGRLLRRVREVWARPGTRLGWYVHLVTQFPMMSFALLWGVPYLVSGQQLGTSTAGLLFALMAAATFVAAPLMGVLQSLGRWRRSRLALAVVALTVATWTAVLALPPPAPRWLLVVLVLVLSLSGPASVIGFDLARSANPPASLGLAQSIVNTGGFSASLLVVGAVGAVVELGGGYGPGAFRAAWLVLYPVWALGVVGVLVTGRRALGGEGR